MTVRVGMIMVVTMLMPMVMVMAMVMIVIVVIVWHAQESFVSGEPSSNTSQCS